MRISRKAILTGAASAYAAGLLRFPAGAAEFSYKMGGIAQPTDTLSIRAQQACDQIAQRSGGRLEIRFFPNYQLGSDSSMLTQLRAGALEFEMIGDHIFSELIPVVGISAIPFVFGSYREARNTMNGPLGTYVKNAIRNAHFYVFEKKWESSFRQIANNVRPIVSPDDLKGIRLRVPPTSLEVACFKAFGAAPTPISANEAYVAIQTHLVDGIEVPLPPWSRSSSTRFPNTSRSRITSGKRTTSSGISTPGNDCLRIFEISSKERSVSVRCSSLRIRRATTGGSSPP